MILYFMVMTNDFREVKYDAEEHTDLVRSILAESHLKPYNIFRHIDPKEKTIVDIGCGDGAMCRESIDKGAIYALGIDGKPDMITVARSMNKGYENKIALDEAFIEDVKGDKSFDYGILSYLLNNAQTFDQLVQQCENTASFLKPGGLAVVYNSNPFDTIGGDFTKYGFRKTLTGLNEGDKIIYDYSPAITEHIINYYISPERHEEAFRIAGFSEFRWEPLKLFEGADEKFWHEYFNHEHLPMIGMIAKK